MDPHDSDAMELDQDSDPDYPAGFGSPTGVRRDSVKDNDGFFAQSPPHSFAAMQLAACCRCHKEFMIGQPQTRTGASRRGPALPSSTFDSDENMCFECRDRGTSARMDEMLSAEIMISNSPPRRSRNASATLGLSEPLM